MIFPSAGSLGGALIVSATPPNQKNFQLAALNGVASDSELKIWTQKFRKDQSLLPDLHMASPAKKRIKSFLELPDIFSN